MTEKLNIMIIEARFYADIADEMVKGATEALTEAGASYERFSVPGAFEIPGAIRLAMDAKKDGRPRFDGYVALGCVIRGETTHYDYVCGESARGMMDLAMIHKQAVGYGILTVENRDQAMARAEVGRGNKGRAAVEACLAMIGLSREFSA
ncbi:MAG: 6,7-dimethyl-8-ribityllumazine synthase [Rhodospirillales bacterium]|jgi:6,7-dimethyl-8-ribityllumazine synthase|nr:6,7-dimethyl-8-ribityllumazine synthase [Rhodospirillales bacterium]MBT4007140.1 6,7-dimethyl-8-ribityllumazine synthase [Rhodospirillales bacterium]MBT5076685.1 6,7-dimethyl-8-ribityllumazine synthase [Rhodospirillales bacterium]MBT5113473.1 6,7-dimethyl-8-ribityllumazine synthase [Rhodospirillales bacterium]MBT5673771.1 6,7-dimethyl-8-ribityllumazine synthase [Rhodospirillales bacterium]